jgi:hypothetical protein
MFQIGKYTQTIPLKSNIKCQCIRLPVIVMNPHENVIHLFPTHWRRMGNKFHNRIQKFSEFYWFQFCHHLKNYVQTHFLSFIISIIKEIFQNTNLATLILSKYAATFSSFCCAQLQSVLQHIQYTHIYTNTKISFFKIIITAILTN